MITVDWAAYNYKDLFLQILMDGRQVWPLVRAHFLSLTGSLLVKAVSFCLFFNSTNPKSSLSASRDLPRKPSANSVTLVIKFQQTGVEIRSDHSVYLCCKVLKLYNTQHLMDF